MTKSFFGCIFYLNFRRMFPWRRVVSSVWEKTVVSSARRLSVAIFFIFVPCFIEFPFLSLGKDLSERNHGLPMGNVFQGEPALKDYLSEIDQFRYRTTESVSEIIGGFRETLSFFEVALDDAGKKGGHKRDEQGNEGSADMHSFPFFLFMISGMSAIWVIFLIIR